MDSTDMRRHILEQGKAAVETLKKNKKKVEEFEVEYKHIILNGAGDKYLIPLIASHLYRHFGKKPIEVWHSRTLADYPPAYLGRDSLVIFLSQSGKTKDTMDAAKVAVERGAKTAVITNLKKREGLWFVEEHGGVVFNTFTTIYPEKPTPSTQTFHATLSLLNFLLSKLAGAELYPTLLDVAEKVDEITKKYEKVAKERAEEFLQLFPAYFLGDGPRYGIARKAALIMAMEGMKTNAFALRTEEFLHSLIETLEPENKSKLALVLFLPPESAPMRRMAEKIKETWSNHADVFAVEPPDACDDPLLNDLLSPQLQIIPIEWLSYYAAISSGVDPGVTKIVKKVRSEGF